jgi:serine/threonine protein kinase
LRKGEVPVLVDFGLSGRHLRPGCGTIDYSAPEVLGVVPEGHTPSPLPTDLYAFGCLTFEALTAQTLFDGDDESEILNQHVSHDGWPARLAPFAHDPETADLAKLLAACLRRDPRLRPTASQARAALARFAANLSRLPWPLVPSVLSRARAS